MLCLAFGKGNPVAPLLCEPVNAQPSQQDIVRRLIFRVQFQPVALEGLCLKGSALDDSILLWAGRIAEDRQAAIVLPELTDASGNTEARRRKTALTGLCLSAAEN